MRTIGLALLMMLAAPHGADAWGREGHRIIADIAEQFLEPTTARQVRELPSTRTSPENAWPSPANI